MDTVTQSDVRSLVTTNGECCVSIYMPTHLLGREGVQDSVRIKNLVAAAERQLVAGGMRTGGAKEFLEPISDLPIQSDWERRKTGLAIFRSKDSMSHYHLSNPFEETLVVGRQFYVKPLLPIVSKNHQFFVLAISRNQVRLLKATSDGYERLELPGLPNNIEQGLNLQTADRGEQVHSAGIRGGLGKEAAVFHGQGGHSDTIKEEVVEYCRLINESLQPLLRQTSWPLILAGVDYELAMYREASVYPRIAKESLQGAFDYVEDWELYQKALPIAQRLDDSERNEALTKYRTFMERNLTSDDIEEIILAACEGKIDVLFADCDAEKFGRFDPATKSVEFVDNCDPLLDLVELTIAETLRHRGTVYAATPDELPPKSPMCALLRY